jgi:hypothetical protein
VRTDHPSKRHLHVGLIQHFGAANALDLLRREGLRDLENVIDRGNPDKDAGGVDYRQRFAILGLEERNGVRFGVGGLRATYR